MIHKVILVTILILLVNKTFSQESNIIGTIVDYETKRTITGATIVNSSNSQIGTISDVDGNFEIKIQDDTRNLELYFVGYYPIMILNIPDGDDHIDFGEVKLAENHLMDNQVVGGPSPAISEEQKEQDKELRKNVLRKYRIKILGKKVKPYFEGKYLVFDFNKNGKK